MKRSGWVFSLWIDFVFPIALLNNYLQPASHPDLSIERSQNAFGVALIVVRADAIKKLHPRVEGSADQSRWFVEKYLTVR